MLPGGGVTDEEEDEPMPMTQSVVVTVAPGMKGGKDNRRVLPKDDILELMSSLQKAKSLAAPKEGASALKARSSSWTPPPVSWSTRKRSRSSGEGVGGGIGAGQEQARALVELCEKLEASSSSSSSTSAACAPPEFETPARDARHGVESSATGSGGACDMSANKLRKTAGATPATTARNLNSRPTDSPLSSPQFAYLTPTGEASSNTSAHRPPSPSSRLRTSRDGGLVEDGTGADIDSQGDGDRNVYAPPLSSSSSSSIRRGQDAPGKPLLTAGCQILDEDVPGTSTGTAAPPPAPPAPPAPSDQVDLGRQRFQVGQDDAWILRKRVAAGGWNGATRRIVMQQHVVEVVEPNLGRTGQGLCSVRIMGVTVEELSVAAWVTGFRPSFLFGRAAGSRFGSDEEWVDVASAACSRVVGRVSSLKWSIEKRRRLEGGYTGKGGGESFFRVSAGCRNDLIKAMEAVKGDGTLQGRGQRAADVYWVDDVLTFMDEVGMCGNSWVTMPEGTYKVIEGDGRKTTTSLEVEVAAAALVCDHPVHQHGGDAQNLKRNDDRGDLRVGCSSVEGSESAVMRLVSVAAVQVSKGGPIQQIATAINVTNSHDEPPDYYYRIFVVGSSGEVNGADKCEAGTEREMLIALSSFLQDEVDPDIVVTFESSTADMITSRMSLLGLLPHSFLGRVRCVDSGSDRGCKAGCANIPGRLRWAVQDLVKSEYCQLRSYDFEALMGQMCKESVILLAEEERSRMSTSTGEQDRASLSLILCTQAAGLLCIMKQLDAVENAMQVANVSGLPLSRVGPEWQDDAVYAQLFRTYHAEGFVMPSPATLGFNRPCTSLANGLPLSLSRPGAYSSPIASLEFQDLYQSIIVSCNLSFENVILDWSEPIEPHSTEYCVCKEGIASKNGHEEEVVCDSEAEEGGLMEMNAQPNGRMQRGVFGGKTRFANGDGDGVLKKTLKRLLDARSVASEAVAGAAGPMRQAMHHREKAIKRCIDAVIGMCLAGEEGGCPLPCGAIASTVAFLAREIVSNAESIITHHFTVANGKPADATVVQRGTDSLLIDFGIQGRDDGGSGMQAALALAEEASGRVASSSYIPIRLNAVGIYDLLIIISGDATAGMLRTRGRSMPEEKMTGFEEVLKTACDYVCEVYKACVDLLLGPASERKATLAADPKEQERGQGETRGTTSRHQGRVDTFKADEGAWEERVKAVCAKLRTAIKDLVEGRVPVKKLLITKTMSRAAGNGTKVTKVISDGSTSLYLPLCPETGYKAMPCPETHVLQDPILAIDSGRQLDYEFYAERQIRPLITQLLTPIVGQKRASQITESIAGSRVMREHLRRGESAKGLCYNCRAPVNDGQSNGLCSACEPNRDDLIDCAQANVFEARREEEASWRECFECSGQDGACAGAGAGAGLVDVESLAHSRPSGRGLAGMCVNFHCNYRYERARAGNRAAVLEAEFELLMGGGPDRL